MNKLYIITQSFAENKGSFSGIIEDFAKKSVKKYEGEEISKKAIKIYKKVLKCRNK